MREDSRHLMEAAETQNFIATASCANVIQGRCQRMVQVLFADIGNNPSRYSHEHVHTIEQHTKKLQEQSEHVNLHFYSLPVLHEFIFS